MNRDELGLKIIESYQKWGEWLAALDLAAIGAVAFLHGFADAMPASGLSLTAKTALGSFGASVLLSSMLVGNLPQVALRFVSTPSLALSDIPHQPLLTYFPSPLRLVSALAGLTFTAGAVLMAVKTAAH